MLMTPFYWLPAPWYRRSRRTTIGEIIEDRYGTGMAAVYSLFAIAFFVLNQGTMFKGAGKIIAMASGGGISPNGVVAAMTAAVLLYSFFGGLIAAAYTDFIQGFLIIALSFMLIPAGLARWAVSPACTPCSPATSSTCITKPAASTPSASPCSP